MTTINVTPIGNYWIIRNKQTGDWLPELAKPVRGGYTHTEPCRNRSPRLFTTERGAKNALWWWLRGIVTVRMTSGDPFNGNEPDEDWRTDAAPGRKAEDMEIVPVSLIEELK